MLLCFLQGLFELTVDRGADFYIALPLTAEGEEIMFKRPCLFDIAAATKKPEHDGWE